MAGSEPNSRAEDGFVGPRGLERETGVEGQPFREILSNFAYLSDAVSDFSA